MNIQKQKTIQKKEKSINIPIKKNLFLIEKNIFSDQYSEKENFFDPSKQSPPNEFMLKLHMRMNNYASLEIK